MIRKINEGGSINSENKFEHCIKEMYIFRQSKLMISATSLSDKNSASTSCLRLFFDIHSKYEFLDIPAHYGETNRVRVNYEENLIFTCGTDGCINMYSIEALTESDDNDRFYLERFSDNFTNTVLIKKSKLKEKEIEKMDAPEKREDFLKKKRSEHTEEREKLQKLVDNAKNKLATTKQNELKIIGQKRNELESMVIEYEQKISSEKTLYNQQYEKQMNDYQVELATKSREVEKIREALRDHKNLHKEEMNSLKKLAEETRLNAERDYIKQIENLESHKEQLEEKIQMLDKKKVLDEETISWLNNRVIDVIDKNILELKKGIEDLKVHNQHQIKKLMEEIEKQNTNLSNLDKELTQISEEKDKQIYKKEDNLKDKKKLDDAMKDIQSRITEVEKKIIDGKKRNQYLEKCKFVLDYKIKELKKEMGPIEKAIEDLKKRTKDLDVELEKFNREHDIINKKLVDFKDLQTKMSELGFEERKEQNEIKLFKNTIFNMVNKIDDYEYIREGFKTLRDFFLKDYKPDVQDMDLDAEFYNQKDNMKKNVSDLSETLKTLKVKHLDAIERSRKDNHSLIKSIEGLKKQIKEQKVQKSKFAADTRHENAIAAINAQKNLKFIEEMEFESPEEKIKFLQELIEEKKKQLQKEKKDYEVLPHLSNVDESDDSNLDNSQNY